MTPDHAHYADWDSAYVLGALEPAERREYEAHLERCERCRAAVAELAPMPGLLSRLSADRATALIAEPADSEAGVGAGAGAQGAPAPALLDAVRREGRRRIRRTRVRTIVIGLVAAAALALAVVLPQAFLRDAGTRTVEFVTLADAPVSAAATLEPVAWGTRIELDCRYAEAPGIEAPAAGWTYGLFVVGDDGTSTQLSTWRAAPGAAARLEAGTALAEVDIAALEIRAMGTGVVLLRAGVG